MHCWQENPHAAAKSLIDSMMAARGTRTRLLGTAGDKDASNGSGGAIRDAIESVGEVVRWQMRGTGATAGTWWK